MDYRFLMALCSFLSVQSTSYNIDFWFQQKRGANVFNEVVTRDLIEQAKLAGIEFIRLAPDKFCTKGRDFLIGNADHYTTIQPADLQYLKSILDLCAEEHMPVVLTMLSLPGSRWKQHNDGLDDQRIWRDACYVDQAVSFWTDCARELRGHPALVAYDILNEPHSKNYFGSLLHDFYTRVIAGIRSVDNDMPIVIESAGYADPAMFCACVPLDDDKILYSFHMYEPFAYTNRKTNQGRYKYPGYIEDYLSHAAIYCNRDYLSEYLAAVCLFQKKFSIPSWRILAGEFGGHRSSPGLRDYFSDLITIFNSHQWHWAVYAFREDTWDGMNYELGADYSYDGGGQLNYCKNPVFDVLVKAWLSSKALQRSLFCYSLSPNGSGECQLVLTNQLIS